MWKFTYSQRIRQKELLARVGTILFVAGFPIFIGSLFAFFNDSTLPYIKYIEAVMFFGQFSIYLGAALASIATFLAWSNSPFWDFIFNQISVLLVTIGFLLAWWNTTHDRPLIQGMLVIFVGFGLIGLGRRFSSFIYKPTVDNPATLSESDAAKQPSAYTPKSVMLDLQRPQIMKSVVGAIVWGFFGVLCSLLFHQPIIILVAIALGLLVGVDKKQLSLSQNLKVAILNAIKTAMIGLCISAIIGAGFVGLLFGFNAIPLLLGAAIGGLIGLLFGALVGAM